MVLPLHCQREWKLSLVSCASGPRKVEQLQLVNVSSSQVWIQWLVKAGWHAAVNLVRVSLVPSDGSGTRTAVLNASVTEYSFRSAMRSKCCRVNMTI